MSNEEVNYEVVPGHRSVLSVRSDDELAKIQARARKLVSQDKDINAACATMIAARRLYALSILRLQKELATEGHSFEDGVEECLTRSMSEQALAPFAREALLRVLTETALPFVADDIAAEKEEQAASALQRARDTATERLSTPIPVCGDSAPGLARGASLILVGDNTRVENVLTRYLDPVRAHNEQPDNQPFYMLHLANWGSLGSALAQGNTTATYVPLNHWAGFANKSPGRFLREAAASMPNKVCDLLIIDNLISACSETTETPTTVKRVLAAHKVLRRWLREHGVGMISVLPANLLSEDDIKQIHAGLSKHAEFLFVAN